jgi:hypothetical protein
LHADEKKHAPAHGASDQHSHISKQHHDGGTAPAPPFTTTLNVHFRKARPTGLGPVRLLAEEASGHSGRLFALWLLGNPLQTYFHRIANDANGRAAVIVGGDLGRPKLVELCCVFFAAPLSQHLEPTLVPLPTQSVTEYSFIMDIFMPPARARGVVFEAEWHLPCATSALK